MFDAVAKGFRENLMHALASRQVDQVDRITDQDNAKGKKAARHYQLSEKLKDRYYCLRRREIENLIAPAILLQTLKAYGETEFQLLERVDYTKKPSGDFIENKVIAAGKRVRKASYSDAGTVSDKVDFWNSIAAPDKPKTEIIKLLG
jgi:hypothetical protein